MRSLLLGLLVFALSIMGAERCVRAQAQKATSPPDVQQLLQEMAEWSPDPCGPPRGEDVEWHSAQNTEFRLLSRAADIVTQQLNAVSSSPETPHDRAAEALKKLEQLSAEINATCRKRIDFIFRYSICRLP